MAKRKKYWDGDNAESVEPKGVQEQEQPLTFSMAFEHARQRANKGDPRARQALTECLDKNPEMWSQFGNLAGHVELKLIETATGGEWLTSEAVIREVVRMRHELAGSAPTPLESLAVERIIVTWLALQHTESWFLQTQQDVRWARYWLVRQSQADRLYRAAVGSLLTIRELLPVAVTAASQTTIPVVTEPIKLSVQEGVASESPWVNRIAGLMPHLNGAAHQVNGTAKVNGHRHRLLEPTEG
ncbi:MAG: hypothetical protein WCJ35_02400 [Planctomycetota bacterium]